MSSHISHLTQIYVGKYQTMNRSGNMFSLDYLPDGLLPDIASYLPNASAAMLAVALTAPSSSAVWRKQDLYLHRPRSPVVAAILDRHKWEDLRFFDFFLPDLARQLLDDDIHAVLVCINAVTKIKKLYLTGCVNVHGRGLDPLCGSTVLEEIGLRDLEPRGLAIIRTLVSIVKKEGNLLKEIQFPARYSDKRLRLPAVHKFIAEWELDFHQQAKGKRKFRRWNVSWGSYNWREETNGVGIGLPPKGSSEDGTSVGAVAPEEKRLVARRHDIQFDFTQLGQLHPERRELVARRHDIQFDFTI